MWTEATAEFVRAEWKNGYSASAISKMLYAEFGVYKSRNAVIGKIHRGGMHRTHAPRAPRPPVRKVPKIARATDRAPRPEPLKPLDPTLKLDRLEPHQCRWIIGDMREGGAYCGRDRFDDSTGFCADHCKLAYTPSTHRQRRNLTRLAEFLAAR